ncbi:MAG: hypothetical protein B6244_13090 [Candidatus Cloacimonetes bacterium 4572_55]|nr:MAG: hypothetical protein B6244_13090 [Candidatus Cloacimonetes bacterium 4572_55]
MIRKVLNFKGGLIMKKLLLIIVILIFLATKIVLATEVGGHLTEDTVWSPENNPYHVVSNIFIEQGVTLTIQPGTQIKLDSAELIYGGLVAFLLTGEDSEAKLFWVDGRIIAEGTADDPITFTRAQDSLYYHWGTIYLSEQSGLSVFKHCLIEYSALIFTSTVDPQGAIYSHNNGGTITENCHFIDNMYAIQGGTQKMSITKCRFEMIEDLHSSLNSNYNYLGVTGLIAGNIFIGEDAIMPGTNTAHIVRNTFQSTIITIDIGGADNPNFQDPIYIYKNTFLDFDTGIIGSGYPGDSLYVKKNDFHGPGWGIFLEPIYFEVEGNMFDNCYFRISGSPHSMVRNNMIKSFGGTGYSGNASIFENNIIYNCGEGMSGLGRDGFRNNVFASNDDVFSSISDRAIIENSAVVGNDRLYSRNIYGNPIFRNCILDFELPEECIDGGGNIWVDSLMIDGLFEDWQNGDFHLTPGSLAIDAGFDTTDYYPYLDPDDNLRVWDGDNDGQAIIDIGPYEYGAPASELSQPLQPDNNYCL